MAPAGSARLPPDSALHGAVSRAARGGRVAFLVFANRGFAPLLTNLLCSLVRFDLDAQTVAIGSSM